MGPNGLISFLAHTVHYLNHIFMLKSLDAWFNSVMFGAVRVDSQTFERLSQTMEPWEGLQGRLLSRHHFLQWEQFPVCFRVWASTCISSEQRVPGLPKMLENYWISPSREGTAHGHRAEPGLPPRPPDHSQRVVYLSISLCNYLKDITCICICRCLSGVLVIRSLVN